MLLCEDGLRKKEKEKACEVSSTTTTTSSSTSSRKNTKHQDQGKSPSHNKKLQAKQSIPIEFVYSSKFLGELPYTIQPHLISIPSHKPKPKPKPKPKKKKKDNEEDSEDNKKDEIDANTNNSPTLETTTTTTNNSLEINNDSIETNNSDEPLIEPSSSSSSLSPRRNYWEYEYEYPDNFDEFNYALTELEERCINEGDLEEDKVWGTKSENYKRLRSTKHHKKEKEKKFVHASRSRKKTHKLLMIAEHFETQKENATADLVFKMSKNYNTKREEDALNKYLEETESIRMGCGLTEKQLEDLLTRDLSPEDYDLLLRLDDTVEKKTLKGKIDQSSFPTQEITKHEESPCVVCLSEYEIGEQVTMLPCLHYFHTQCIINWLTNSSLNCPVDNLPLCISIPCKRTLRLKERSCGESAVL